MNPEVKTKWLEALRSGKYKQGQTFLNVNNEEFCCLGVLCEIAVDEGIIIKRDSFPHHTSNAHNYGDNYSRTSPPSEVVAWAGLPGHNPLIPGLIDEVGQDNANLMGLNDDVRWSFDQIADAIEEHF